MKHALMPSLTNCKANPNDVIFTPIKLAKEIIAACDLKPGDTILDPFRGGGAFYDNYPDFVSKDWCELSDGKDFLQYQGKVDWIISNPPFSKLKLMIPKMASVATKGICLILGWWNLTSNRIRLLQKSGFTLTHMEMFDVKEWYGFRCIYVIFEANKPTMKRLSSETY